MNNPLKFLFYGFLALLLLVAGLLLIPLGNSPEITDNSSTGMACGGFAGIECPLGFECVTPERGYPDMMGTCQPGLDGETQQSLYSFANKMKAGVIEMQRWIRSTIWSISQKLNPNRPPPFGLPGR